MRLRTVMLATLMGISAVPAMAQPRWGEYRELPYYEHPSYRGDRPYYGERYDQRIAPAYEGLSAQTIARIVRSEGLMPISRPLRREDRYIVFARDPQGGTQRVVIDARSGDIIRVVAARPEAVRPEWREGGPNTGRGAPEYDREPGGPPPMNRPRASVPGMHPEGAPPAAKPPKPKTAKVNPDTPPMPRARPNEAPNANPPSRVILPGGPAPKEDRTAGRPYAAPPAAGEAPVETPPAAPPPVEAAPPAPTEAAPPAPAPETAPPPSPGRPDPSIPPAQSF